MQIQGVVQNGVIILEGGRTFPDGTRVFVSPASTLAAEPPRTKKRITFPLVASGDPGSIHLTNAQIYGILDEEDIEALKRATDVPS